VGTWSDRFTAAFHTVRRAAGRIGRRKVKPTPFDERNGKVPFNASGVVQVGPGRFVFIDNHDSSAFFELALDADGVEVERIWRRPLTGLTQGQLGDPEGLTRVDVNGEVLLIAASSLCVSSTSGRRHDGLVRVRYRPHGDLHAEPMDGFREWLLLHASSLAASADREPDAGGLNVEGLAWDPHASTLLFGLRGPADRGRITVIRVPVDAGTAAWTTASLGAPSIVVVGVPQSAAAQGIRDISYDEQIGDFLILIGRSTSRGDEPFQLCTWNGDGAEVTLLDVRFHRSMKPEGITTFSSGDRSKLLVVDDNGGYAVLDGQYR
jgi:Protein of unknown function (DUF3616)